MTVTAPGTALGTAPRTATWASLHCYLHWAPQHVDDFLLRVVAPYLGELRAGGRIDDWFFIRYSVGGPHLRIRVKGGSPATMPDTMPDTMDAIEQRLAHAVRSAPHPTAAMFERPQAAAGWHSHGEIESQPYEPETTRYGGPGAIDVAEDVFCRSTEIALDALAQITDQRQRLTAAIDLALATAAALDLDDLGTARWLSTNAFTWRWHRTGEMAAPAVVQGSARAVAADKAPAMLHRWAGLREAARTGRGRPGRWAAIVRAARQGLEIDGAESGVRWLGVWASQLHMLCNRLGLLPDDERWLSWFVTESLLTPQASPDFFADDLAAADRRYLCASRYRPAVIETQQPRMVPKPQRLLDRNPYAGAAVALPAGDPPDMPLAEAFGRRITGRGDLGGELTAAELGTLLWSAFAPTGDPYVGVCNGQRAVLRQRPFPSAGRKYVTGLRLVAWRVTGLQPGMYCLDEAARALDPLSAAPSVEEAVASSMWFVRSSPAGDRIDVSTLPALLGLYIELGALRAAYGLRAMRFAMLEAGHLAQNLALAAAATGLSLATIGGFYDDIAHELFMLDGLDDVLVYLLPVGRARADR